MGREGVGEAQGCGAMGVGQVGGEDSDGALISGRFPDTHLISDKAET